MRGTHLKLWRKTDAQLLLFILACFSNYDKLLGNEFAIQGDTCSHYDTCTVTEYFRTCNCDDDCHRYGTCCRDAPTKITQPSEDFECYSDFVTEPIFMKKSCSPTFFGDPDLRAACETEDRDWSDLMANVLVSSNETWTTYKNWNCALCNHEKIEDLWFWTVQASYSIRIALKRLEVKIFRKKFIYDDVAEKWGVYDEDGSFIDCPLEFYKPVAIARGLRYCAGDITSKCLPSWDDIKIKRKCESYYGERKLKNTKRYFKNVHCALCNGLDISDLQCFGRNYRSAFSEGNVYTMRVVFNLNPWTGEHTRGQPSCGHQERYDPFLRVCRNVACGLMDPSIVEPCGIESGSGRIYVNLSSIALNIIILLAYIACK